MGQNTRKQPTKVYLSSPDKKILTTLSVRLEISQSEVLREALRHYATGWMNPKSMVIAGVKA